MPPAQTTTRSTGHALTICRYGMDTLKFSARLACHTTRTLVTKNVPRLPWSDDKFHTPSTLLYTCSWGSNTSCLSLMMAPRSFKSRYSLDVS